MNAKSQSSANFQVIVVGAGIGGICAAVAAARTGAQTCLIEKAPEIGGTGVHSPVSLVCKFHGTDHRPINLGIHRELFFELYAYSTRDFRPTCKRLTYDEAELLKRYKTLILAENNLSVRTGVGVASAEVEGRQLKSVTLDDGSTLAADCFVDATADGNLGAMAGCEYMKGRESDGAMQSATLTFSLGNIDTSQLKQPDFTTRGGLTSLWQELTEIYVAAKKQGLTANPKDKVIAFPYPDGQRILFNSNEVLGVDPTDEASLKAGQAKAEQLVKEMVAIFRKHPAFAQATLEHVSTKFGIREGRRIVGDYVLTQEDCLGEARFDDMIAACAYEIDIHDPDGGPAQLINIPGSGYYHIPYRCIVARDLDNLALGSRCISGTHEAHSSYRVMSGVSAIGQAAGTASALASREAKGDLRTLGHRAVQTELRQQVQFVEFENTA